jgi:hypothetical protein
MPVSSDRATATNGQEHPLEAVSIYSGRFTDRVLVCSSLPFGNRVRGTRPISVIIVTGIQAVSHKDTRFDDLIRLHACAKEKQSDTDLPINCQANLERQQTTALVARAICKAMKSGQIRTTTAAAHLDFSSNTCPGLAWLG